MSAYVIRRLLLVIPTLIAIMIINFLIVQAAPGGPIDVVVAQMRGLNTDATARFTGAGSGDIQSGGGGTGQAGEERSRAGRGLDPAIIKELEKQFGFDKPLGERFVQMMTRYVTFDFGRSYFKGQDVIDLVAAKLPVSISIGLWTTLFVYLVSIPLGIRKAIRDGSRFDVWTSGAIIAGNAIPGFLFAVLLVVLFAGGSFLKIFPLRGLTSEGFAQMSLAQQVTDYLWHMVLPVTAMVIGGFAGLTILTKNSFLDEIGKQYVITARAKGLTERRVLYGHVFRNAMLIVIAGFPAAFIGIFFGSSLLIEVIFSLDGLGQLGWEAAINRDYPVMFATLYVFTLMGLLMKIVSDITYTFVDPRIDFAGRA
jgi:microcin C transport system permease protein